MSHRAIPGMVLLAAVAVASLAQIPAVRGAPQPNLVSNIERPLRYRPDGADFVIENGTETFNRPLYGRNTAFRVDGGDKPEFVLYLPGRGGNLRLGVRAGGKSRWLHDAQSIVTRYRPGSLLYEIRDPLLGESTMHLSVLALEQTDGVIVRAELKGADVRGLELIAAFGGINGERGARDGDIGTEAVPISQWFQLAPEFARANRISIASGSFEVDSPAARIAAVLPAGAHVGIADANTWASLDELLATTGRHAPEFPVAVARFALATGTPQYLALQRVGTQGAVAPELPAYRAVTASSSGAAPAREGFAPVYRRAELPDVFARAEAHFAKLREQIRVKTPDPYIDAAVGALNVAADAVWDEPQQVVMHGAIAWRARLLGWRGPYAMDALGWHDRARTHFRYWATRQDDTPIPATLPPADEAANLARNEQGLHSNGDLSASHYDMNLVYIDALLRHLLWTGDLELGRELWPVIERHLAWERRLFRREFGGLPLYEAYAAIWASDDLQYHGGGVAHASAYNYWHNTMAARLATLLGHDAAPFAREATLIRDAMQKHLWLPEQGMFAEFRDSLGLQRAHPSAALWSFYHPLDGVPGVPGLVDTRQAWQMTRYVDRALPHLPVRGPGVPEGDFQVIATSNWMPYTWSINNVVMGENAHTALGFWQAGRGEDAFKLLKSALLASMYMGISPGNVGSMNYLDVHRRESQRDFADGAGVTSRALVEGLFGVRPDALAGVVEIHPGWPSSWNDAAITTPDVTLEFESRGDVDRYRVESRIPRVTKARLRLRVVRDRRVTLSVNGSEKLPVLSTDEIGRRWLVIEWPLVARNEIKVQWFGMVATPSMALIDTTAGVPAPAPEAGATAAAPPVIAAGTRFLTVDLAPHFNARVTEIFAPGKYRAPRSPYVSLAMPAQGIGAWAGHVNAKADIDDAGLRRAAAANGGRILLPNGVPLATPGEVAVPNILFTSQWDNYPREARVPLAGRARHLYVLMAGSTNHMQSRFDNGELVVTYADGSTRTLKLHNPTNWWPIDQDYFIDDYQFRRPEPIPPRVNLASGEVRMLDATSFKGRGGVVPGGAATVLDLALDPAKPLKALTVRALANEVVIGLMAVTLVD